MSFQKAALNPGNINVRLGALMAMEEQAIKEGELETAANIQGMMADYLSVFMDKEDWKAYQNMPGFNYGDERTRQQVHSDLSARRRFLLAIARDNNVFAKGETEIGDASSLEMEIEGQA